MWAVPPCPARGHGHAHGREKVKMKRRCEKVLTIHSVYVKYAGYGLAEGTRKLSGGLDRLPADGLAGSAFLVTNTSASIAALSWMFAEWIYNKRPTVLGLASGIVAGLVAITLPRDLSTCSVP